MKFASVLLISTCCFTLSAQDIRVEYDKTKDYSGYKSFRFGESEIIIPKEQKQISDAAFHKIIRSAIKAELEEKSLVEDDSLGELVVTYVVSSFEHSERQNLGPLGTAPGSSSQSFTNNYSQGELIIDLNDAKNKNLIWRIKSSTTTGAAETQTYVEQIADKGFKKFGVVPKKKKK